MQINSHSLYNVFNEEIQNNGDIYLNAINKTEQKIGRTKEELNHFINDYSNIEKLDISLVVNNDKFTGKILDDYESAKERAKHNSIPNQETFQTNLDFLFGEIENILLQGFNNDMESKEFQGLLASYMMTNRAVSRTSYEKDTQDALQALSQLKNGNQPDNFKETLSGYMTNSGNLAFSISHFFYVAEYFDRIPKEQKSKIQNALEEVQTYLLNQAGGLDNKSFQLGDATISWNGEDLPFKDYYKGEVQIVFADNALISASNFDSTQSFLDMLDKRDKLEKEQQDLQEQKEQRFSDTIFKELLGMSKDKKVQD